MHLPLFPSNPLVMHTCAPRPPPSPSMALLVVVLLLLSISAVTPSPTGNTSLLIDCGGSSNFTDSFNRTWLSDRFFSSGSTANVSDPYSLPQRHERTLRFFPPTSSGEKNCYSLPVPEGRFYVRFFTIYRNYDRSRSSPSFDLAVSGTPVLSWRSPWPASDAHSGAYSDLFAFSSGAAPLDLCLHSIATDFPVISSLEVFSVDPSSYDSAATGRSVILVNHGRVTCGAALSGPGFTKDPDQFDRFWKSDEEYRSGPSALDIVPVSTDRDVLGANRPPNYFPKHLYRTAVTTSAANASIRYMLPVDPKLDYMVWMHFAEIDPTVTEKGQRVFDVLINGENSTRIDVFGKVGRFRAFQWRLVVRNLTDTPLDIELVPVVGAPIVCGIENYAVVKADLLTLPEQVTTMKALKQSLRIPDRMGWNGDPCAPSSWDAWEGVTCHQAWDVSGLVITQLDLGSQGLQGNLNEQINLLTNLVSLNLSSNSLDGNLPSFMGLKNLVKLDLSGNQFSGNIPDGLCTSSLQIVLLHNNQLEGHVPVKLYSIGLHGGIIDLSGNKGLCGVPTLPPCSFLWGDDGELSRGGKLAIGLLLGIFILGLFLAFFTFIIRRRRHDYNFAFSKDLTSSGAKRNRYQRQKPLVLLEMQAQHENGFPPTLNPL